MAFDVNRSSQETPQYTVVSSYEVHRLGQFPAVRVAYEECVFLTDDGVVEAVADDSGDGALDTIIVPALGGRTDLVGRDVVTEAGALVGKVLSVQQIEATPAGTDGAGIPVLATYKARITLNSVVSATLVGAKVGVVKKMPVGTTAYRRAKGGKRWETLLTGQNPSSMEYIKNMLGTAYFTAVRLALVELGLSAGVSDAQLVTALNALAAKGTNIDGILAQQAEKMERDRVAGTVAGAQVYGEAPPQA